ncbi:MAG TPA: proton-conducting transporter membrane subunit [Candidatus Elarobacter sp.]|nr:proton-conducting transporter membrane subunit [Candidatus Elarobacter sp.]
MTPDALAPLALAVPLAAAALCAAIGPFVPRRVLDALAIAAGLFCIVDCVLLTQAAAHGTVVHWFGGWTPRHGVALGIAFTVDAAGGALAAFTAFLSTVALQFSWTYYDESGPPFPALMLVFMAALIGFFLTGDLFNLFVFFELMGVAAYALTAYRSEDESAVMGAFSFAVLNSIGAFLILLGIAIVYGRTGALNMAQISHALGSHADALVVLTFAFIAAGLLVKAALVPFHFWLADAHAVAPTPLCVLFSGIMVQAGLYAVARVYWSVYSGALAEHEHVLRTVLIAFGIVTAFTGAFMSFGQRHFKRLLAFSTVAHTGILVCAFALLSAHGVAGMIVYILGHGLTKGGLFMCSGILLNRLGSVDVEELRGKLRTRVWGSLAIFFGALALAGLPPFGTFLGTSLIEHAADDAGLGWLPYVLLVAAALTGGSVLNALGRMAFGWGPPPDPHAQTPKRETRETRGGGDKGFPLMMYACSAFLIVCACAVGLVPGAASAALGAGERFVDRTGQLAIVLKMTPGGALATPPAEPVTASLATGFLAAGLALAFAAFALFGHKLRAGERTMHALERALAPLRRIHDGVVTDYVAWLAAGTAALGTALAAWMR